MVPLFRRPTQGSSGDQSLNSGKKAGNFKDTLELSTEGERENSIYLEANC